MQLFRTLPDRADAATAIAVGNFDGLHRGHRAVLDGTFLVAAANNLVPGVLTFEPHPRRLFTPHAQPFRLEPLAMKLRRLREAGVERVYMPRFNRAFAAMEPVQFLDEVLRQSLGAKVVITGANFAFGRDRLGDIAMLRDWGIAHGIDALTLAPLMVGGIACSSSEVRQAIGAGDMVQADRLLGRPYRIAGRVRHGDGRGAGMGFATANLALPPGLKMPLHGVYAVRARLSSGRFDGVANLGVRPTVGAGLAPNLEVHLFGGHAALYGQPIAVDFHGFVRAEKKFDSLGALTAQIAEDCAAAQQILSAAP